MFHFFSDYETICLIASFLLGVRPSLYLAVKDFGIYHSLSFPLHFVPLHTQVIAQSIIETKCIARLHEFFFAPTFTEALGFSKGECL